MDLTILLKVLGTTVVLIASFMELYKKKIRRDKASKVEIHLIAVILSSSLSTVGFVAFDLFGNPWAILYYSIGVYIAQCYVDMKIVKLIVRSWLKRKGIIDGFNWDE